MELLALVPASTVENRCHNHSADDRSFLRKMTGERVDAGLPRLRLDPELSFVASKHTSAMVRRGELYHSPMGELGRRVTRWRTLGENIGKGHSVEDLHSLFMADAAHRHHVMFSKYRFVGVGSRTAGGYLWVTIVFEGSRNPGTTLKMPPC